MRSVGLRIGFFAAAAAIAAVLASSDAPAGATAPALHEQTFIDRDGSLALSVQLDVAAPDAGHWTFRVPAVGVYSATARASMAVESARSVVIDFSGAATLRTIGGGTASARQIRLRARIDPERRIAEAQLRDGRDQFELHAKRPDVAGLDVTVAAVESAILANDPAALYLTLNAQATSAYTPAAFVATWNAESAARGRITALRRTSLGQPQVNDQGFAFVAAEYSADYVTPAGSATASFTAFFIHEPTGWKFWTTVRK